jgi:hypothetical protein
MMALLAMALLNMRMSSTSFINIKRVMTASLLICSGRSKPGIKQEMPSDSGDKVR